MVLFTFQGLKFCEYVNVFKNLQNFKYLEKINYTVLIMMCVYCSVVALGNITISYCLVAMVS